MLYIPPVGEYSDILLTKVCRRCGAEFTTKSRVKKRCDACQSSVTAARQPVYAERVKARKVGRG